MLKSLTSLSVVLGLAFAGSASASENWAGHRITQQAVVKLTNLTGGAVDAGKAAQIDAYLSTRDPDSPKVAQQPQAAATVRMVFPQGSVVNPIGTCPLWPTTKPWDLKRLCGNSVGGEGWALVSGMGTSALPRLVTASGGTVAPSGTGNYSDAPSDCSSGDATQYSRTYEGGLSRTSPMSGLSCTPLGYTWVHVFGYLGTGNGKLDASGYIYDANDVGTAPVLKTDGSAFKKNDVYPVTVTTGKLGTKKLTAGSKLTSTQVSAITAISSKLLTDKTAIVFANDNGLAALSFAGTITKNSDASVTLNVDLPAFNSAGLKGFLPLDNDLVDFRFVTTNPRYVAAGAQKYCPGNKTLTTTTAVTFSPFPGDYAAGNTSAYPAVSVPHSSACK